MVVMPPAAPRNRGSAHNQAQFSQQNTQLTHRSAKELAFGLAISQQAEQRLGWLSPRAKRREKLGQERGALRSHQLLLHRHQNGKVETKLRQTFN